MCDKEEDEEEDGEEVCGGLCLSLFVTGYCRWEVWGEAYRINGEDGLTDA